MIQTDCTNKIPYDAKTKMIWFGIYTLVLFIRLPLISNSTQFTTAAGTPACQSQIDELNRSEKKPAHLILYGAFSCYGATLPPVMVILNDKTIAILPLNTKPMFSKMKVNTDAWVTPGKHHLWATANNFAKAKKAKLAGINLDVSEGNEYFIRFDSRFQPELVPNQDALLEIKTFEKLVPSGNESKRQDDAYPTDRANNQPKQNNQPPQPVDKPENALPTRPRTQYSCIVIGGFDRGIKNQTNDEDDFNKLLDISTFRALLWKWMKESKLNLPVWLASEGTMPPPGAIVIQGEVLSITHGSQALRYAVGFGAGKGEAEFLLELLDPSDKQIIYSRQVKGKVGGGIGGGTEQDALYDIADKFGKPLEKDWH